MNQEIQMRKGHFMKIAFIFRKTVTPWFFAGIIVLCGYWFYPGLFVPSALAADAEEPFNLQKVIDRAKALASKPFQESGKNVPDVLAKLTYDQWRDIRFDNAKSLWASEKLPFVVRFFHPGFLYTRSVKIYEVEASGVRPVPFSPTFFDYGQNDLKTTFPADMGYAGFRVHYPINTKGYKDEVVVFLGASYFRAVAKGQNYGISARGLAIDTALPKGEEFPQFTEFWLVKPKPGAVRMTIYALLDSQSVTGAYRFSVEPGKETVIDVRAKLFFRKQVEKLCLAPLTSMFFYGENTKPVPANDYRPEVHDSDGLMVADGAGRWIWRPLINPRSLSVSSFQVFDPLGFGLIQRDTNFDHYQDLEAHYESRPSVWIAPGEKWGEGRVELVQIPTDSEMHDNIVSYWVPAKAPEKGKSTWFSYKMVWYTADHRRPVGGRVVATRTASGKGERDRKFVLDFQGGRLDSLAPDKPLSAVITVDPRAKVLEQQLFKNRITKGWRLVFQIAVEEPSSMEKVLPPHKREPLELRAFLKLGETPLTETWSYLYYP
jgi:glucans biosynthesis protein